MIQQISCKSGFTSWFVLNARYIANKSDLEKKTSDADR